MPTSFYLSEREAEGAATSADGIAHATIDAALKDAEARLQNGAEAISIVDRDGHLILPADQVRLRLHPLPGRPDAAGP